MIANEFSPSPNDWRDVRLVGARPSAARAGFLREHGVRMRFFLEGTSVPHKLPGHFPSIPRFSLLFLPSALSHFVPSLARTSLFLPSFRCYAMAVLRTADSSHCRFFVYRVLVFVLCALFSAPPALRAPLRRAPSLPPRAPGVIVMLMRARCAPVHRTKAGRMARGRRRAAPFPSRNVRPTGPERTMCDGRIPSADPTMPFVFAFLFALLSSSCCRRRKGRKRCRCQAVHLSLPPHDHLPHAGQRASSQNQTSKLAVHEQVLRLVTLEERWTPFLPDLSSSMAPTWASIRICARACIGRGKTGTRASLDPAGCAWRTTHHELRVCQWPSAGDDGGVRVAIRETTRILLFLSLLFVQPLLCAFVSARPRRAPSLRPLRLVYARPPGDVPPSLVPGWAASPVGRVGDVLRGRMARGRGRIRPDHVAGGGRREHDEPSLRGLPLAVLPLTLLRRALTSLPLSSLPSPPLAFLPFPSLPLRISYSLDPVTFALAFVRAQP
ncbi:hypothetical protein FB451DRAFT_1564852 [Mycena latifolia]|nr:hypothetical protein FB451DRAFT_1564852 [Mycena latifolia]